MLQRLDDGVPSDFEPAPQIIPDREADFVTGLGETKERIAAITADLATRSGADLPSGDVTANVVLRTVGVQRDFWPVQHHQQFAFVRMQPGQQAVKRDETGATAEDTVEPGTQRERPAPGGFLLINLEIGVEVPDETANAFLSRAMLIVERVQLMHQPLRVNPAQRMVANVELPGIVTQHNRVAQEFMRLDTAPQGALGGDPNRVWRGAQRGETEQLKVFLPRALIGETGLRFIPQPGDQRRGQAINPHV